VEVQGADAANAANAANAQEGGDTIDAGPLTLSVSGAPASKRIVFRVRH
jgi:hypothetical protein